MEQEPKLTQKTLSFSEQMKAIADKVDTSAGNARILQEEDTAKKLMEQENLQQSVTNVIDQTQDESEDELSVTEQIEAEFQNIEVELRADKGVETLKSEAGKYHNLVFNGRNVPIKSSFDTRFDTFFVAFEDGTISKFDTASMREFLRDNEYEVGGLTHAEKTSTASEVAEEVASKEIPPHEAIWQEALYRKQAAQKNKADRNAKNSSVANASVTKVAVTPVAAEPVIESQTEPVNESVAEPATEPVAESITKSMVEPVAEPVIEPAVEPVIELGPDIEITEKEKEPKIKLSLVPQEPRKDDGIDASINKVPDSDPIDSFVVKSVMLEQFLNNKSLQGKRTPEEILMLQRDIKLAASRVIDGEEISSVIASLGLNSPIKVSKTMAQDLPKILQAEFAAHHPEIAQKIEDAIANNEIPVTIDSSPKTFRELPDLSTMQPDEVEGLRQEILNGPTGIIFGELEAEWERQNEHLKSSPSWKKKKDAQYWNFVSEGEKLLKQRYPEFEAYALAQNSKPSHKDILDKEVSSPEDDLNKIIEIKDVPVTEALIEKNKDEIVASHKLEIESREKNAIEQLRENLEAARSAYAQEDYKKTTAWDNLKRFFGRSMRKDEDEGVVARKVDYNKALTAYIEARLQEARELSTDEESLKTNLVEVLKVVELSERMFLYEARTDAKIPPKFLEKIQTGLDWYRDLPLAQKLAFSGVMIAGGIGLGASVGAGAASALFFSKRLLSSAVAGRGAYEAAEALLQNSTEEKQRDVINKIGEDVANMETPEEMMARLQERIYTSVQNSDVMLNAMMKNRLRSTVAGFATGAFFGAGIPSELLEKFQGLSVLSEQADMRVPEVAPIITEVPHETVTLEVASGSGDGIESQLIHHLETQGHSAEEAGKMAHRMLLDYAHDNSVSAKDYDSILSGKITLDTESLHIQNIEAVPMRGHEIAHHVDTHHSNTLHSRLSLPQDLLNIKSEALGDTLNVVSNEVDIPEGVRKATEAVLADVALESDTAIESVTEAMSESEIRENAIDLMKGLSQNSRELWADIKNMTVAEIQRDTTGAYDGARKFIIQHLKENKAKLTGVILAGSLMSFVAAESKKRKRKES